MEQFRNISSKRANIENGMSLTHKGAVDSDVAARLDRDQQSTQLQPAVTNKAIVASVKSGKADSVKTTSSDLDDIRAKGASVGVQEVRDVADKPAVLNPAPSQQQPQAEDGKPQSVLHTMVGGSDSDSSAFKQGQQTIQRCRQPQHPAISLEAAAVHALCASAGWLAIKLAKSFRKKQPSAETAARAAHEAELQELAARLEALQLRLEQEEGDHSATRSENELMKREMDRLRSQLEAAQRQTERYHATARHTQSTAGNDGFGYGESMGYFDDDYLIN